MLRWPRRSLCVHGRVSTAPDRVKRRGFVFLTGATLTTPAQWLVHEPGPLISGLAGRRVSTKLPTGHRHDHLAARHGRCGWWWHRAPWHNTSSDWSPIYWTRRLDAAAERGMLAIDLAESLDSARGNSRLDDHSVPAASP